jgi:hypothetical protein
VGSAAIVPAHVKAGNGSDSDVDKAYDAHAVRAFAHRQRIGGLKLGKSSQVKDKEVPSGRCCTHLQTVCRARDSIATKIFNTTKMKECRVFVTKKTNR